MSKEEFEELQLDLQKSGKPLMSYLHDIGITYRYRSTYGRLASPRTKNNSSYSRM